MSPMRAAMSITPDTCAGSVRSTGASGEGGGAAFAASIVAIRPLRLNNALTRSTTVLTRFNPHAVGRQNGTKDYNIPSIPTQRTTRTHEAPHLLSFCNQVP